MYLEAWWICHWLAIVAVWIPLVRPVLASDSVSFVLVFQHVFPRRQALPAKLLFTIFHLPLC